MKSILSTCFILVVFFGNGQSFQNLELLAKHVNKKEHAEKDGLIQIEQFLDNCIYEHSCGEFSKGAIHEFGIIKGFVLSIDRRLRCGNQARSQMLPIRFNPKGEVKDHWTDYRAKTK